jgi:hypothetical protein
LLCLRFSYGCTPLGVWNKPESYYWYFSVFTAAGGGFWSLGNFLLF